MESIPSRQHRPHCISPPRQIPFSPFWFSTICCAVLSRAQWHLLCKTLLRPASTPPATAYLRHYPRLSSSWLLRNLLQTRLLTSLCATAKRALPFSTSKDINTTTILTHNP